MKEIKAIIQPFMLESVLDALHEIPDLPAVTISDVRGIDTGGKFEQVTKTKLEIMVPDELITRILTAIQTTRPHWQSRRRAGFCDSD